MNKEVLKFLWQHIKPYKWLYLVMLMAPIISSFYFFAYNYAAKLFIDTMAIEEPLTYQRLLFPILLFIGAPLVQDIVWRLSNIAEWTAEPYVRRSILLKSYDYVQHHSYRFFQDNFTGALSSKVKGLLDGYDKFWADVHHGLLLHALQSFVCLIALSIVSVELSLLLLVWSLIYVTLMYKLSKHLNALVYEENISLHSIIGQVSDNITNMLSLFSFASRSKELKNLDTAMSTDFIPKQIQTYKYDFKIQIIGSLLYLLMYGIILFMIVHLRMKNAISLGDIAFVMGMTLGTAYDIWKTTISLQDFSRSMGNLRSALSILNVPHENLDQKDATPLVIHTPSIHFKGVSFEYAPGAPILQDLTLSIKAGEKIGLVGPSGAGKSTFVNLLLRYFEPTQGQLFIDQQDLAHVTQDSLRAHISVIPQDILLFHRTLMENIRYGNPEATDQEVIAASKKAHIDEFVSQLPDQYQTFVGERGIKLSGGQRQRIAIARAILKDSPILVLDEATSSLDSHTEQLIQESLTFLMKNKRKTVIAIAHRLSTLQHMDRIIVLDKGRIVEEGTHETLIKNPKSLYTKLWKLQKIS